MTLALAMLAVVVLAGLLPDTGVVSASSNCTYGKCPAAQPFPLWAVGASVAVVVIALILALLLLRRSRRRPPNGGGEPAAGAGTAGATWSEGEQTGSPTWDEANQDAAPDGETPEAGEPESP